jgi:AcrR family transcriptional regulator
LTPSAAPTARRPGRPPTGARERLLDAGLETLLADGYAGLTTAKVAVRAGENKALIAYHFGSKDGLVGAAAGALGGRITAAVLAGVSGTRSPRGIIEGILDAIGEILDGDVRIARAYFDLNAVAVVADEVRAALREVKGRWREVLRELLLDAGTPARRVDAATILVIAGAEGLVLERLERGETRELAAARRLFIDAAAGAIGPA